jgi:hypothetical protein
MNSTLRRLAAFAESYPRIAITGGPKTGKTTLADRLRPLGRKTFNADDLIDLGWSEASAELAKRVNEHDGPCIVEGVSVPRALRKGMRVDAVLWLDKPHVDLKAGQVAMGKGVKTVMSEWRQANPSAVVVPWSEAE